MPPLDNNQVPPPPVTNTPPPSPENLPKKPNIFLEHWKAIVFGVVILIVLIFLTSLGSTKKVLVIPKGDVQVKVSTTTEQVSHKKVPVKIVTQTTKDQAISTANNILNIFNIAAEDPFKLDNTNIEALDSIKTKITASSSVAIFDGQLYSSIELYKDSTAFYIKPANVKISTSSMIEVIDVEKVNPDDILKGLTDTETKVYHIFYDAQIKSANPEKTVRAYLDSQISNKTIESYKYSTSTDFLSIKYPNDDIPSELEPAFRIQQVQFVINSYANPAEYAKKTLTQYIKKMANGEALITYKENDRTTSYFLNNNQLLKYLSSLTDSKLTTDQKTDLISGGVNIIGTDKEYSQSFDNEAQSNSSKNSNIASAVSSIAEGSTSGRYDDLYSQSGTIVPPTKELMVVEAPDYNMSTEFGTYIVPSTVKQSIDDKETGIFSPYWKNDYNISYIKQKWNEENIEILESIFSNSEIATLFYHAHGNTDILLSEIWDEHDATYCAQSDEILAQCKKDIEKIKNRITSLEKKYGDMIDVVAAKPSLSKEDADYFTENSARIPFDLKDLLSSDKRIIKIRITDLFLKNKFTSRAIMMLLSCYGGALSSSINTRVLIATDPKSETTTGLFVVSDLMKLFPYLIRDKSIDTKSITKGINRNFNVLDNLTFKQGQILIDEAFDNKSFVDKVKIYDECIAKKDTLCTIKVFAKSGNSVAVSPQVDEATSDYIKFNAPMDTSVDISKVVTINATQCHLPQAQVDSLKPSWNGDKTISLPWKDKVYREWKDTDFYANGSPQVNRVMITVHNDSATSKYSNIPLTGNPEACEEDGCFNKDNWKDPAAVKNNATKPKSDFVMSMPCIDDYYYEMCKDESAKAPSTSVPVLKVRDQEGKTAGTIMPKAIKYNGIDYNMVIDIDDERKAKAQEIKDGWVKSEGCPVKVGTDCLKHIISSDSGNSVNANLMVDGVPEPSCDTSDKSNHGSICHNAVTYGDHFAWIRTTSTYDPSNISSQTNHSVVVYDRKDLYQGDNIGYLTIYKNHVIYMDNKNNDKTSTHLYYDGKDVGLVDSSNSTMSDLFRDGALNGIYGDHLIFRNNQDKIIVDGKEQGNISDHFYGLGNHYRAIGYNDAGTSYIVDGKDIVTSFSNYSTENDTLPAIFGDNVACGKGLFGSKYAVVLNGKAVTSDDTIEPRKKYMEEIYNNCLKKENEALCKSHKWGSQTDDRSIFYYDGGLPLYGFYSLWGDHLAFLTNLYKNGTFSLDSYDKSDENENVIYNNGEITNIPNGAHVRYLELFENNLYYGITFGQYDSSATSLYRNGAKIAESKKIDHIQVFGDHYAYVNENTHVIYDGKDLGFVYLSNPITLYGDHITFMSGERGDKIYYDGKYYSGYGTNESMFQSIHACRKGYIEDVSMNNYDNGTSTTK